MRVPQPLSGRASWSQSIEHPAHRSVHNIAGIVQLQRSTDVKYKIALHQTAEGYAVSVPGLPGCWSQGETEEEALANIHDAILEYLAARDDLFRGAEVREVEVSS